MRHIWAGILVGSISWAQTIFFQEDFNNVPAGSSPEGWQLNTSDLGGTSSPNYWRIDKKYGSQRVILGPNTIFPIPITFFVPDQPLDVSGAPQSNFLYITTECDGLIIECDPEYPVAYLAEQSQTAFTRTPSIDILAGTGIVKLSFFWMAQAGNASYGEVYYREGNGNWQRLTSRRGVSQLRRHSDSWYADTITLNLNTRPTRIQIGFRFVIGRSLNEEDPSIAIDEVRVFEESTTPPAAGIRLGTLSPSPVCAGSTLSVTYNSSLQGNLTYTAEVFGTDDNIVASASGASPISIPIPNTTPSGTYRVRVAANTNPPTYSDTATITIVNVQSLSCSATPNPAVPGTSVTLEIRGTGLPQGPFNVQVDPGDGSSPLVQNNVNAFPITFTHTYASGGSYTATFTVTHPASGCQGTCQATVDVGGERLTALALRESVVCPDDSFYVQYSSVGIVFAAGNTFTVEVRDGSGGLITSCQTNSTATSGLLGCRVPAGTQPGDYSVRISSSSPSYNSNTLTLRVSTPPRADFAPDDNLRFCAKEPITFTDRSQGATQVSWDFGDGRTSTQRNPTHTYAQGGTYTVTLVASISSSCTDTIRRTVEVLPAPQAAFRLNPTELQLPEQNTVTLTNTSTGAVRYEWDFGNGQRSTAENPTATYDREGTYTITLVAISAEGCRDTARATLKVSFAQGLFVPQAFTPNGDGINDRYIVRYSGMETIRLSIYDRWGNLIFSEQRNTSSGSIEWDGTKNGQPMPEGVYAAYLEGKSVDGRDIRKAVTITLLR